MVLKFAGVESISDAEQLKGCEIQVPAAERTPLGEGESYVSDLVGCAVLVEGQPAAPPREIGAIANVTFGAGEAPLLVIRGQGKEREVPFAAEYVVHLDVAAKRLVMRLPEGMLELDAPLSRDEKHQQHHQD
jgi:16S rRNA processing protein RimM